MVTHHHVNSDPIGTFWSIKLSILSVLHLQMHRHKLRIHVIKRTSLMSYFKAVTINRSYTCSDSSTF